jgi:hypothetical protein
LKGNCVTPELTAEELHTTLDEVVDELLVAAGVDAPPVSGWHLAHAQRLTIAEDARQLGRARYMRPRRLGGRGNSGGVILMRPEPRVERRHWAVAHEVGEHNAHRVFRRLGIDPRTAAADAREQVANYLANRLLLPTPWFGEAAAACDWDLISLKREFTTASHELIARRMLDFPDSIVITVCDNASVTFRRGNLSTPAPAMLECERRCWQQVNRRVATVHDERDGFEVSGWPVHEDGWQREILRLAWREEVF